MAAYRRVYDSHYLQADCQEPGSAPECYVQQSSMGDLTFFIQEALLLQTDCTTPYVSQKLVNGYITVGTSYMANPEQFGLMDWEHHGRRTCN